MIRSKKLKNSLTIGILLIVGFIANKSPVQAAYYPSEFAYTEAGFNQSQPLQQKLNTTRGEFSFKKSGFYIGASDAMYQERISNEEYYEMDAYAGIKQNYGNFGYHLGLKSYNRSIEKNIEIQEYYIGGNFLNLGLSYATNGDGEYTQINFKHKVSFITLGIHLGKTKPILGKEFSDWSVHASRMYRSLQFNAVMTKSDDPRNSDTQFNLGVERVFSFF